MSTEKQILIERFKKINNPEILRKFFSLLHELIEVVNLPSSSRKIAFVLNKNSLKITAFINAHSALQISGRKENIAVGMIFKNEVLQQKSFPSKNILFKASNSKYILGQITFENRHLLDNQSVLQAWSDCISELENTASSSPQRQHHNSFLYEIAENEAFRQEFFQETFQSKNYKGKNDPSLIAEPTSNYSKQLSIPQNLILVGPPGTGKTHYIQNLALSYPHRFITFHQSYSYEEFVEGIRPETIGSQLRYHVRKGIFYEACLEAIRLAGYSDMESCLSDTAENRKLKFENAAPFLLVIDEINRANISKVLGELITLVEPSKRLGAAFEISTTLPYSQSQFGVPSNLYVVGTMNSADRSTALLDMALRRRFTFQEFLPDYELLDRNIENTHLGTLLKTLNERIVYLLDSHHVIGHSYLLNVQSFEDLCAVFSQQIIPLLQEYFYEDWSKIRLVLADNKLNQKPSEAQFIQIQKEYTPALEKQLFGQNLDLSETVVSYQINQNLIKNNYDQLPRNIFQLIYEK